MATYEKGKKTNLSINFKSTEFDCHGKGCCTETTIDPLLVTYLQKIRTHFGKSVTINSGYRCPKHNKAVGGASKSRHVYGMAADIAVKGVKPAEVAKYAESIGIKGIGLYESKDGNFVHIDTRDTKAFWYGHAQLKRTTFGGAPDVKLTVLEWQKAAFADGFSFPKYGTDGEWGSESAAVARKAICKKRITYKYKNLTKLVQRVVGVEVDGKFGNGTKKAVIEWQKNNGLVADGEIGLNSWKKILGV